MYLFLNNCNLACLHGNGIIYKIFNKSTMGCNTVPTKCHLTFTLFLSYVALLGICRAFYVCLFSIQEWNHKLRQNFAKTPQNT